MIDISKITGNGMIEYSGNIRKKPHAGEHSKGVTEGDSVTISQRSREINEFDRVYKIVSQSEDVNWDKIAELKRRIQNGTYYVPAKLIAEKMWDEFRHSI
ncbi:MAG: flagellar biosynthesis anti-sigma factor FlgM [bacterium]